MRTLTFLLIMFVVVGFTSARGLGIIKHQDRLTNGTGEPAANLVDRSGDAVQILKVTGQYGLSFHFGCLMTYDKSLFIDDNSLPTRRVGIPLGIGLYYFVSERVAGTIDLAYARFPEWYHLWGSHSTWSMLEFGVSLKHIWSPTSSKSLYGKLGLKMARLSGSRRHGPGLFGGSVGSDLKTKTTFTPGGELAIGLTGIRSKGTAMFVEVTISHLLMKGSDVRMSDKTADWSYPSNLTLYGVKVGILITL